jgi:hypothetical protein
MQNLQALLENEKDILAKRKAEGRNDLTARLLIGRIELEITRLERRIQHAERKNELKHVRSSRFTRNAKEFVSRNWLICYKYCNSIFGILTGTTSKQEEGVK